LGSWVDIDGFLAVFAWLMKNLPAYALPALSKRVEQSDLPDDWLLKQYKQHFTETVTDKRVLYESLQIA